MSKRLLPQSIESEKIVLGLMTSSHTCLVKGMKVLKHEKFFHKDAHRFIYSALHSIYRKDKKPSLIILEEELKLLSMFDKLSPSILVELMESALDPDEFESVLDVVEDKFYKRNLVDVSHELNKLAYNDHLDGSDFIRQAKTTFSEKLEAVDQSIEIISSGDVWEKRKANLIEQTKAKFLPIGYENMDNLIVGGWIRKQVSVTAGRPGMGKSTFKTNLILNQVLAGKRVVSFAPEQGFDVEQARLEALMTDIPLKEVLESYKWRGKDYRVPKIQEANRRIDEEFKYHIVPTRGLTSRDTRPILYEISQRYGPIDLVFIDLFDKFTDVNTTENTVNAIAVGLQNMAQYAEEFDCHINLLVQISREAEKKGDKHPKIRHLKNSGAYEEVARLILLLFREKYYFPDTLNDEVQVEIAKQSNGPLDSVYFEMDEDTLSFTEKAEGLGTL